jgi:hypothetical protein
MRELAVASVHASVVVQLSGSEMVFLRKHRRRATFEKRCGHIRSLPPFFIASLSFLPGNQQHGGERCEQQASRAAPVVHISPMSTIDLLALFGAELPLILALRMCRMCHGQTSVSWCSAILTS